ncbi:MAG: hypothetical protein HYT08_00995 [Candidatus Levybacteria bacterium]|nr:hypothetical protein [Candidatus Levybacteria bacterium]
MTSHQQKQIEVINQIEKRVKNNSLNFSTVSPVKDYINDTRVCLTSVHLPNQSLLKEIKESFIEPLINIEPDYYYYNESSLHITIKSVRVINDPPHFTEETVSKAKKVFSEVIPSHKKFKVYFYRFLLFPNNLTLVGTTDPEFDELFIDLDKKLNEEGIPDDKKYSNPEYYFVNMTLVRFPAPSDKIKAKIKELLSKFPLRSYMVDSVTLLTCNAVFKKRRIINSWKLK